MYRTLRIQPMRELVSMQNSMDRLLNTFFDADERTSFDTISPRVDMKQDENNIYVKMTIPGVNPDDIQISVAENILTVKAEVKEEKSEKDEKSAYEIREHTWSSYYREISLPSEVEADKAKADYENGVLKLELPKAEIVKPKMISINARKKGS